MNKIIKAAAVAFAILLVLAPLTSAYYSYKSYTYDINGNAMESPDAFVPGILGELLHPALRLRQGRGEHRQRERREEVHRGLQEGSEQDADDCQHHRVEQSLQHTL